MHVTPWRNGSASDSRSEGCVFKSRRGHKFFFPRLSRHFFFFVTSSLFFFFVPKLKEIYIANCKLFHRLTLLFKKENYASDENYASETMCVCDCDINLAQSTIIIRDPQIHLPEHHRL